MNREEDCRQKSGLLSGAEQLAGHGELRLDRMRFVEFPWAERRFYWLNDGGSHHFGAARYQACRLGMAVPLTGRLCRYSVNMRMSSALLQQWNLFVLPADELFGSFSTR